MQACITGVNTRLCIKIINKYSKKRDILDYIINETCPSPLLFAVINGNLDVVTMLLPHVNFESSCWNESALYYAQKMNRAEIAEILLQETYYKDRDSFTVMYHEHIEKLIRAKTMKHFICTSHKEFTKISALIEPAE